MFDPWHYLPVLQRKPGALRNGAPFKDWALPVAIKRTLERLKSSYRDWDRQSGDILSMVPVYGLETVARACDQALLSGSVTRDRVLICSVVPTKRKCPRRSTPRPICNCVTHH